MTGSVEEKWEEARARLERLMARLPEIEQDQLALRNSSIAWKISHHESARCSAWELAGQLEQRLSYMSADDPNRAGFTEELGHQRSVMEREARLVGELLAEGGFANEVQSRKARLDADKAQALTEKVTSFVERYQTALERCQELDELLDNQAEHVM